VVENRCHRDGKVSTIQGKAWVPDAKEPGKLKVQFFWPFSSDYWVHAVGPNYEWALVGNAKRSNAWILSRTPTLDPRTYDELEEKFRTFGYDPSKLELIPQNDTLR
jgi:lipocalin